MSGEQVRLQAPPKLYRVHSWITQIIRQWVPNCRSGNRKSPSPEGAALNTWNRQLMTSGRSQMVTTGNCGNWHAVVGEICWSPMPETSMDCDSQLVLHPLRNTQSVQIIMHQPRQTTLACIMFAVCCDTGSQSLKVGRSTCHVVLRCVRNSIWFQPALMSLSRTDHRKVFITAAYLVYADFKSGVCAPSGVPIWPLIM